MGIDIFLIVKGEKKKYIYFPGDISLSRVVIVTCCLYSPGGVAGSGWSGLRQVSGVEATGLSQVTSGSVTVTEAS